VLPRQGGTGRSGGTGRPAQPGASLGHGLPLRPGRYALIGYLPGHYAMGAGTPSPASAEPGAAGQPHGPREGCHPAGAVAGRAGRVSYMRTATTIPEAAVRAATTQIAASSPNASAMPPASSAPTENPPSRHSR
jgi:hypothetical protein